MTTATGPVLTVATHGCVTKLIFAFQPPESMQMPLVEVLSFAAVESEGDCPAPQLTFSGTSGPGIPPMGTVWKWYYFNSADLHNANYNLTVSYRYKLGMGDWQGPYQGVVNFDACNAYVMHAKDAVADAETGFCLFDPLDFTQGHNCMQVEVKIGDLYLNSTYDSTMITVIWHDPVTGQDLHTETDNVSIGSDGTVTTTLDWSGMNNGQWLAKGAYPYTAYVDQPPPNHPAPVTHQWASAHLTISGVSAEWEDEDTVEVSWTATVTGQLGLYSTEVLAISPSLTVITFGGGENFPNGTGAKSVELDFSSLDGDGKWTFLVRAKDLYNTYNRAHENRYAQLKGAKAWRSYPAENYCVPDLEDCDDEAVSFQHDFPEGADYYPRNANDYMTAKELLAGWQTARVFSSTAHTYSGEHRVKPPYEGAGEQTSLAQYDPYDDIYLERLGQYRGDISLALFFGCYTASDQPAYGNLCQAALSAGAESVVGFTNAPQTAPRCTWTHYFWYWMNREGADNEPCTVSEALEQAKLAVWAYWGLQYWGYDSGTCLGNSSQTLWPVG